VLQQHADVLGQQLQQIQERIEQLGKEG